MSILDVNRSLVLLLPLSTLNIITGPKIVTLPESDEIRTALQNFSRFLCLQSLSHIFLYYFLKNNCDLILFHCFRMRNNSKLEPPLLLDNIYHDNKHINPYYHIIKYLHLLSTIWWISKTNPQLPSTEKNANYNSTYFIIWWWLSCYQTLQSFISVRKKWISSTKDLLIGHYDLKKLLTPPKLLLVGHYNLRW